MAIFVSYSMECDYCGLGFTYTGTMKEHIWSEFDSEKEMLELSRHDGWEHRTDVNGPLNLCPDCKENK